MNELQTVIDAGELQRRASLTDERSQLRTLVHHPSRVVWS